MSDLWIVVALVIAIAMAYPEAEVKHPKDGEDAAG